jgi:hypothetical protein
MKQLFALLFACMLAIFGHSQVIGIGTNTPDPSARLEVADSIRGFLPPRVALNAAHLAAPVTGHWFAGL